VWLKIGHHHIKHFTETRVLFFFSIAMGLAKGWRRPQWWPATLRCMLSHGAHLSV
jgi:hypothetical protein